MVPSTSSASEALSGQHRQPERLNDLLDAFHLLMHVFGSLIASRLVLRVLVMAERLADVEGHSQVLGLFFFQNGQQAIRQKP